MTDKKQDEVVYTGVKLPWDLWAVFRNNQEMSPARSQEVWNYCPDGFAWGSIGVGSAQLALALLLDATGYHERVSLAFHQEFKRAFVAEWKNGWDEGWSISRQEILEWLAAELQKMDGNLALIWLKETETDLKSLRIA